MKLQSNTVLITGGASGIGLALAERFLENQNTVIICGRDKEKLDETKAHFPSIHTKCCDVSNESDRVSLFDWAIRKFPNINIIINNAGIQQRVNLKKVDWEACRQEIATNLDAPIHLSTLFISHLSNKENAFIINVTSGLAFMPPVWVPVYGATKAGLHPFTFCLREQLSDTHIGVIEIIPPAVNTNLGGTGIHTFGVDANEFVDNIFKGFADNLCEIGFADNLSTRNKSRAELEENAVHMYKKIINR